VKASGVVSGVIEVTTVSVGETLSSHNQVALFLVCQIILM